MIGHSFSSGDALPFRCKSMYVILYVILCMSEAWPEFQQKLADNILLKSKIKRWEKSPSPIVSTPHNQNGHKIENKCCDIEIFSPKEVLHKLRKKVSRLTKNALVNWKFISIIGRESIRLYNCTLFVILPLSNLIN